MNLVIDIGNTQAKIAWFEKGVLVDSMRLEKKEWDIKGVINKRPIDRFIVSSVGSYDTVMSGLKDEKIKYILLDHKTPLPVKITYLTPDTLGHDRIAAAAGASYVCPLCNVMIIDMGTAITIDLVDSEGTFLGGNISPGLLTRFRSLHEFTAKLPLTEKDMTFPGFGTDTRTAIVAGVQQGIIFEINGYIDEYSRLFPSCKFILTGGDADFFVTRLKKPLFAIPDLVLKGLNFILDFNFSGPKP